MSLPPIGSRLLRLGLSLVLLPGFLAGPLSADDRPVRVRTALFLVADGVYNSELMAPWDVLQHTVFRDETDFVRPLTVSADGGPVRTFEDLVLETDHSFADAPPPDILVIPSTVGSMDRDLADERYMGWLREAVGEAEWVITVCDGAFPLAATGALDGRQATTFPADRDRLAETFPAVTVRHDVRWVVDGKFVTSVGGGMSYEPAFWLVEHLYGREHATVSARGLVWPWEPEATPHLVVGAAGPREAEATSLLGRELVPPELPVPVRARLEADLERARARWEKDPDDVERIVWLARRLGYLWRFREAIDVLSRGLELHPDDVELLRHRGHRYLSVRDLAAATRDLGRAAALLAGTPDRIEPDGAPNEHGIPRSTLHFNVLYHLGLARYLEGDLAAAAAVWERLWPIAGRNDDLLVATGAWWLNTAARLGEPERARPALEAVREEMDVLESGAYQQRLLLARGLVGLEEALGRTGDGELDSVTLAYGAAVELEARGEAERASALLAEIAASPQWNAFAVLAAEADLARRRSAPGTGGD